MQARHAVVTGGGSGIGAAVAKALAHGGMQVTLMGRSLQRLQSLDLPGARCVACDVADPESVQSAFEQAAGFGAIDVLVNNAGIVESQPFSRTSHALWQRTLDVNLGGVFLCTQQVLPGMVARGFGRVVNVASTAALTGYAYVAAYCAAKHGVLGLTRALALEVAKKGVTVNAVCPGYTDTDIVAQAVERIAATTGRSADEARATLASSNPQGRLVRPEEVADAVAWLCRAESAAINGQAIAVAGGETM